MADGLRCAEFKGAGLGPKALGSEVLAKEALARRPLVRKMLAREAPATGAQTFVHEQGRKTLLAWRRGIEIVQQRDQHQRRRNISDTVAIAYRFKPAVSFCLLFLFVYQASYMISITIIAFPNDFPHDHFLC